MVRTTPTQSPRRDRSLPRILGHIEPSSSTIEQPGRSQEPAKTSPQVRSAPATTEHHQLRGVEAAETSFTERRRGTAQGARPPPILKKPRGDSSKQLSKITRILTPTWKTEKQLLPEEVDDDAETAVVSPAEASETHSSLDPSIPQLVVGKIVDNDKGIPSTKISSSNERPSVLGTKVGEVSSSAKSKSKKPTFVASTASTKRRPQMSRRKSSNSAGPPPKAPTPALAPRLPATNVASNRSTPPKPPFETPPHTTRESALEPALPQRLDFKGYELKLFDRPPSRSPRPPSARSSRSASPVLSRPASEHVVQPARDDGTAGTQSWLVDVDFKAKFANKLRQQAEAQKSSDPSRPKVSSLSTSKRGKPSAEGKGKSVMILGADDEEGADEDHKESTSAIQSSDDEEDDEKESATTMSTALPKTKSQLTLLLERERRRYPAREEKRKNSGGSRR